MCLAQRPVCKPEAWLHGRCMSGSSGLAVLTFSNPAFIERLKSSVVRRSCAANNQPSGRRPASDDCWEQPRKVVPQMQLASDEISLMSSAHRCIAGAGTSHNGPRRASMVSRSTVVQSPDAGGRCRRHGRRPFRASKVQKSGVPCAPRVQSASVHHRHVCSIATPPVHAAALLSSHQSKSLPAITGREQPSPCLEQRPRAGIIRG